MTRTTRITRRARGIRTPLADGWTLSLLAGPAPEHLRSATVPATVPGSVHTDLLAAGLIPDPYLDDHEALLAWIGRCDWRYATSFEWRSSNASDAAELVFEGLDTVATVRLNGTVIAETRNMHRSYRLDVRALLRDGRNDLEVDFASAIRAADAASVELGYRPHVNHHPFNALRKMACSFGWDWGIDTSTAGLWKPAALEEWSVARLASVRPVATVEGADGVVAVHVEVARAAAATDAPLEVVARIGDVEASARLGAGATAAVLELRVPDAAVWWPRGYGEPALHELVVTLADEHGELEASVDRVGFRTVTIDTTPDAAGTPFTLVVNGRPVFVKGANWIPDDAFPHRVDRARYARRLDQAEFAGLNLIRVWGGGIYESDDFYDLCDERGLLTWQDFLLACAAYAEEEPLRGEIEAEAREAVARLGRHPSLVVFNGNNENLWGHEDWNWKLRLDGATWGAGYYDELFPRIVDELAPHVPYTPGSPFAPVGGALARDASAHPNDPARGTMHIWDLWNQKDHPHYREYRPRFVAEFGWQAPPTWSTLTRAISDDPLTPESPGMLVHQKAMEGNVKLTDGLLPHLRLPGDMRDWHWAMQLNQANAITTAVEWFRSLAPHCMGSIVWQLNDCWPVTSWAAVDGDERAKPLLYALRNAHADRVVTVQPADPADAADAAAAAAGLVVAVVNDTDSAWTGSLELSRLGYDGAALAASSTVVTVGPRSVATVSVPASVASATDAASELLRAELDGVRGLWFFAEYRDSALDTGRFTASLVERPGGVGLRVSAETLLRDVTLLVDVVDPGASVDRALVTLLPGESAVFDVTTDAAAAFTLERLTAPEVLRTANQLVAT
ncbi:glycoside hydrolase family 2 protein [Agromyces sp. H66]|uniref:glycoside hydrolase family 2 protein n=1 Tax=Agromyces sp. H66 TaxID=2529859 RepID=UPI0020BF3C22|nr:glycoside hydrolase family 2 protein [Agromyces sp. H66]